MTEDAEMAEDLEEESTESEVEKLFTQEDVDKIAQKNRARAKRSAEREILEKFGVETVEALEEKLSKQTADKSKAKSTDETTSMLEELKGEMSKFKTDMSSQISELRVTNQVEKALIKAGLSVSEAERVRRLVEVPSNASIEEIEEEIETLQGEMPHLFNKQAVEESDTATESRETGTNRKMPQSDPGSSPRRRRGMDPATQARTLLHERYPQLKNN